LALPLAGIQVVEVSSLVAGPAMGSLLRDLGAQVIKIEQPGSGDPSRTVSPWGFLNYNLGKQSLSLNLKSDKGQEILHRLIRRRKADVFLENMGPDVSSRLGFSYPTLRKINPGLIYCSIKGAPTKSRFHDRPAFDAVAQALSGMMSLTGETSGEPARIGNPAIDLGAAAYGAIEVIGALLQREKTKKGKFIEISLLDMSVYWNGYWLTYFGMTGKTPVRLGSGHPGYAPHKVFETKDQKRFLIATLSDSQWKNLAKLLDLNLDTKYDAMKFRITHRTSTEKAVQNAVTKLNSDELVNLLGLTVPCAEVRSIAEVYNDKELSDLDTLQETVNIFQGNDPVRIATSPVKAGNAKKPKVLLSAPKVGQDNEIILRSLGYKAKDIELFSRSGYL
jgi:crotonobetainyl-CoA:carnitine CoA-transferase CaiB-like acyl-CoA transferase